MPTFLLLIAVLLTRLALALMSGAAYLVMLPVRTALAVAPHTTHARWVLIGGLTGSLVFGAAVSMLLAGGAP
jgi:hypothetical protein